MKSAVLVFPGSNREGDVAQAIELVTGRRPAMVWHGDGDFDKNGTAAVTYRSDDWDARFAVAGLGTGTFYDGRGNQLMPDITQTSTAVADAVKKTKRVTITISGIDGVAEGDLVRIKLWRDNTVGSNAAGTAVLRGCTLRFSFA